MRKDIIIGELDAERVGLYVRISEQDRKKLTKSQLSKSIENQIAMLKDEAKERDWKIIDIYCDEDISGADQTRPEFNRMLKDCENKRINIVLCKSQDRFARNMEIIERYIHDKFIEWGTRFVTIVDRADTNIRENKKNRQITGLTSEWYLEDLSNNIKMTFNNKRKRGDFIGSFAPYGYNKQRDIKNVVHLIVDPVASNTVKRIFNEYVSGKSLRAISRDLNNDNVLSPSEYKWYNGIYINTPTKMINDNSFIKSGGYLVKTSFFNEVNNSGDCIKQISKLSFSGEYLKKNSQVFLYKTNAKDVYYTKENIPIDELLKIPYNSKKWIKLSNGDIISNDATHVMCVYDIHNKYEELYTIFEINIESNVQKQKISFETFSYINDIKSNSFSIDIRYKSIWQKRTIEKILTNPVYIGTTVQGKTTTVSYKNHKIIKLPEEQWQVVKDTHDPIIDLETWMKVQDRRKKKLKSSNNQAVNEFGGILKCGYCGKSFIATKCGRKDDKNQTNYYVCSDRDTHFANCLNKKMIRKDELKNLTISEINSLINIYKDNDKIENVYKQLIDSDSDFNSKFDALNLEKKEMLKAKEKNMNYIKSLFESKTNGLIDDEEYFSFKNSYKQENDEINDRIKSIDDELELIRKKRNELKNKDIKLKKYDHIDELNYEIVHEFISEIKIGLKQESNTRGIEFVWNF